MKRMIATAFMIFAGALLVVYGGTLPVAADDDESNERRFSARLSGFREVPTISTSGTGSLMARLSADGASIDYELTYSNLSNVFAAHIHLGRPAVNGGIIVFLCGGGGKPACPLTGGTVTGTLIAADVIGPAGQGIAAGQFDELVAALRAGAAYANVHTNDNVDPANTGPGDFPAGEIRGDVR